MKYGENLQSVLLKIELVFFNNSRNQTNVKDLLSSSLVVYYSDNGKQYELLLEQQFMYPHYHI